MLAVPLTNASTNMHIRLSASLFSPYLSCSPHLIASANSARG
jgi:hypothetical protein